MMMAINDASIADTAFRDWHGDVAKRREHRVLGANMYFVRMLLGHALEALNIVREMRETPSLIAAVAACDAATRNFFDQLVMFLNGTDYATLVRIRNNLAFHYDGKLAVKALRRIVQRAPDATTSFTLGTDPVMWHFPQADEVVDSIMVRDVLGITSSQNAQQATDAILHRMWRMQVQFADFAGYFIRRYA
jgi:hypothetical protein